METRGDELNTTFRSLASPNYRLWAAGAIVSNVGTWMQRTAQDWIVLTQLSNHNAFAVGVTMALQFGPSILLLPLTGLVADRMAKRRLLQLTQGAMGALSLALGILTVLGLLTLGELFVFAALVGIAAAFDAPARQSFVSELVDSDNVSNAVALNSASFNLARLAGPALAGLLMAAVGAGWVFLLNAVSFLAVLASLQLIRTVRPPRPRRADATPDGLAAGFRYLRARPALMVVLVQVLVFGALGLNFPIYVSTMAVLFHENSVGYGLLSTFLAVGAVTGALLAAHRERPRQVAMVIGGAGFGIALVVGALAPSALVLAIALPFVGLAAQSFTTTSNALVQLSAEGWVRGRVMAIYMAVFMGSTVVGAPIVGAIVGALGPRAGLMVGAAAGFAAAAIGLWHLVTARRAAFAPAG